MPPRRAHATWSVSFSGTATTTVYTPAPGAPALTLPAGGTFTVDTDDPIPATVNGKNTDKTATQQINLHRFHP